MHNIKVKKHLWILNRNFHQQNCHKQVLLCFSFGLMQENQSKCNVDQFQFLLSWKKFKFLEKINLISHSALGLLLTPPWVQFISEVSFLFLTYHEILGHVLVYCWLMWAKNSWIYNWCFKTKSILKWIVKIEFSCFWRLCIWSFH